MDQNVNKTRGIDAFRPYLIATAIVIFVSYCGLMVWIAFRPSEILNPDDKAFWLMLLIMLPGRYALEWVFDRLGLHPTLQKRLSGMAFVGLLVGLLRATDASGTLSSVAIFLVTFAVASIAYLVLDFSVDWLSSQWNRR